jgi:ABC-2 type transport system ATP-binding protein
MIDNGALLESDDKETFLDRWRRILLEADPRSLISLPRNRHTLVRNGRTCTLTTGHYSDQLLNDLEESDATVVEIQPMTLEEIFLARIGMARKDTAT